MCGELHMYVRCEIMSAGKKRLKEASASSAVGLSLRIILSLGGVELIHVNQGYGPLPFSGKSGERRCQHSTPNGQMLTAISPPFIRQSICPNERSTRPLLAAQKLES